MGRQRKKEKKRYVQRVMYNRKILVTKDMCVNGKASKVRNEIRQNENV
jgi:hypothetical protein